MNRLQSRASANTRSTQIAVSSNNGGLGSSTGDLVMTAVCGPIGVAVGEGLPGGSRGGEDWDESVGVVVSEISSVVACVTCTSGFGPCASDATISVLGPPEVGSGRHSRVDFSQREHTQLLDRTARRFLSDIGASIPPTPSAAFPRRGKKPCKPRIAVLTPQAGCHDSSW